MKKILSVALILSALVPALAATSEISVNLKLDNPDFVIGERVRGVVDIVNVSPEAVACGYAASDDRFVIEVYRSPDRSELTVTGNGKFVAPFMVKSNEGQKLEVFLADNFDLRAAGRYQAKPVLIHRGTRYEGQMRAFDIVPGMKVGGALQLFSNHQGLKREFMLVCWRRSGYEHLFLTAQDSGTSVRAWRTTDLGELMKITQPTISIMPTGEVIVFHRIDSDNFIRSEFWSVPQGIEFNRRELVQDPETAGSNRIRELYKSKPVKPKEHSWWKFWE